MLQKLLFGAACSLVAFGAGEAAAAPVTYTHTSDGVDFTWAFVPNVDQTVILTAVADTDDIAAATVMGGAGACVLATSATAKLGAMAVQAIVTPVYVCARPNGQYAGFYSNAGSDYLFASSSAYVIDLDQTSNAVYGGGDLAAGTATVTVGPFPLSINGVTNTLGPSSFDVDVAAAPPPAAVPTLSEWAMILLGALLVGTAAVTLKWRRRLA